MTPVFESVGLRSGRCQGKAEGRREPRRQLCNGFFVNYFRIFQQKSGFKNPSGILDEVLAEKKIILEKILVVKDVLDEILVVKDVLDEILVVKDVLDEILVVKYVTITTPMGNSGHR